MPWRTVGKRVRFAIVWKGASTSTWRNRASKQSATQVGGERGGWCEKGRQDVELWLSGRDGE